MRTPFTRFLAKTGAVLLGLLTFLLLGSALSGGLSVVGALCLIPACAYVTAALAEAALTPKRRRARRRVAVRQAAARAPRPVYAKPALRVVQGQKRPGGQPPHAA